MKINIKQVLSVLFLLQLPLLLAACSDSEGKQNSPSEEEQFTYIQTEKVSSQNFEEYITLIGTVKAEQSANLASEEGGRIKTFKKDKGSYLQKGEVIAEMDNDVIKAQLDAAKAQYDRAETNFKKQEQIYNQNVTSEIQFLNAKYDRDAAKANYELIKSRYERTFIKAPFSGIIDNKFYEEGETAAPMTPIVSLVNMDVVKVEAGVPENYVNQIKQGDEVIVLFRDLGEEFNEKVSYVGSTISPDNRTFPIEVRMRNPERKIKPELNADLRVVKSKMTNVILVPEELVQKTDLGYVVFVENNGKAEMREVDVVTRRDNKAAIKSGLKEGDNLITIGYQNLVNGENVKVVNNG